MQKFYEKDVIKLFLGDCIEILNKATPESVDMIFADPLYMLPKTKASEYSKEQLFKLKQMATYPDNFMQNLIQLYVR